MSGKPSPETTPASWPRLVRDLAGLRVRLTRTVANGVMTIPAGTIGTITSASAWERIAFKGDSCGCCGVKPHISRLGRNDLEPTP